MKKKTHALTVLLLKDGFSSPELALRSPADLKRVDVSAESLTGSLHFKKTSNPPKWVKLFAGATHDELDDLFNAGSAAVLLVTVEGRTFALPFGYGRTLLNPDCYEENFGLYVVLNAVNPQKLRSVDVQTLDAVPVYSRSQASVATEFSDFGLDVEQDLMFAATGEPKSSALGKQITGKDAVRLTLPLNLGGVPVLLEKLLALSKEETYKEGFGWVDHLSQVRSAAEIDSLNAKLIEKIATNDLERTWLSVPEIIDWADVEGFKYRNLKSPLHLDISWATFIESLDGQVISLETLKKSLVLCIRQSDGHALHHWPVLRCVYCELDIGADTFALTNGKWYRVDADFLGELNKAVDGIKRSLVSLPEYSDSDEGAYNLRVHQDNPECFALMDKKTIAYGGGHSKIEFCDLMTLDRQLIHVKRYGGSSVLSHLFAQGQVSARLLLSDGAFRDKVNAELPPSHQIEGSAGKPDPSKYEVVYAVVSNNPEKFQLPLFSKITLRNNYKQLRMFGMEASLAVIKAIDSGS